MSFPASVVIDAEDWCDGCGVTGVHGVAWGSGKPVLCFDCVLKAWNIRLAHPAVLFVPPPVLVPPDGN